MDAMCFRSQLQLKKMECRFSSLVSSVMNLSNLRHEKKIIYFWWWIFIPSASMMDDLSMYLAIPISHTLIDLYKFLWLMLLNPNTIKCRISTGESQTKLCHWFMKMDITREKYLFLTNTICNAHLQMTALSTDHRYWH